MRTIGKQGLKWQATRKKWLNQNPPNHQGYWECKSCGAWIINPDLHHIDKRGSHPESRYDLNNLIPLCRKCHAKIELSARN